MFLCDFNMNFNHNIYDVFAIIINIIIFLLDNYSLNITFAVIVLLLIFK